VEHVLACADLGGDLRRIRVNAVRQVKEGSLVLLGRGGGVGPVRRPVGAHAAGEVSHVVPRLLRLGLGRLAAVGEQVLARSMGRRELGITGRQRSTPLLSGSGKFGTSWERMHREKASSPFCCAAAAEEVLLVVEPGCAT
jgi:hypothetical protein